jgi:wyosine [tRNA(Phe)-imidazoG37] synthetase (radical SAM superfamily)
VSTGRYVYGPVPSRRLGRSLGVDLVPFKTCTYDCIYCQLGRTTNQTIERREYISIDAILAELEKKLAVGPAPDYVSLAGSGEPTLHARIGELIGRIKRLTAVPVAVLTNGSLLWVRDVQDALMDADLVLPSLDAGDAALYSQVNRPHPALTFEVMVEGLRTFRERFTNPVWLEILLLAGLTGIPAEVKKIAALARRIRPTRVQLNTVTRPPCEEFASPIPADRLASFAALFQPPAEVISDGPAPGSRSALTSGVTDADLLALLRRRPCTAQGVAAGLGLHIADVTKRLYALTGKGSVASLRKDGLLFYKAAGRMPRSGSGRRGNGDGHARKA